MTNMELRGPANRAAGATTTATLAVGVVTPPPTIAVTVKATVVFTTAMTAVSSTMSDVPIAMTMTAGSADATPITTGPPPTITVPRTLVTPIVTMATDVTVPTTPMLVTCAI